MYSKSIQIILKTILFNLFFLSANCFSQIAIPKTSSAPVIDGRVNDTIWASAAVVDKFLQREPNNGEPLTEKTEVFILIDSDNIYFGIKCYQDPETIAAQEMQRGASLPNDDRMHIVLDTFLDGRNAFIFEVNALGSVGDALVSDNGRLINRSWEGLFIGKSHIADFGWEAELAIPFKTLSFDPNNDSWGLFMNRFLETTQEWGSWPKANINMPEYAVSDGGVITGLGGLSQGVGLDIAPYALTGYDYVKGDKIEYKFNGGTDFYYRVTPSLKASLSINTDFAEIEADSRQINLSRFNIRLSEKRNFFLDGGDLFTFGIDGRRTDPPSGKLSPFFSRRMGLDSDGAPIPINYAAKLTGRVGNWNIGMLHVNEDSNSGSPNSSVARVSYNIGGLSSVGMITTYGNSISEATNLVTGVDLNLVTSKFNGNKNVALMLFGIKSKTEDVSGDDVTWGALLNYPNDKINFKLGHQQVGENFFTGIGFIPRTNIKESWGDFTFAPRLNKWGIRQYSIGTGFQYVSDMNDVIQNKYLNFNPVGIRLNSGDEFKYSLNYKLENLVDDFNIFSDVIIPIDEYEWLENEFSLSSAGNRNLNGSITYTFGDFYTGTKESTNLELNWKALVSLFIGGTISSNKVVLPDDSFSADVYQINVNILFSPDITLYNLIQFDSESEIAGFQSRFRWILKPGNEILLVWNSAYTNPFDRFAMNENSLRLKLKYNIRF